MEANGKILADPDIQRQLTDWVNSNSPKNTTSSEKHPIRQWLDQQQSTPSSTSTSPTCIVRVGYETCSHSPELAVKVIRALGGQVMHHGVATTPLLHHVVFHQNAHRAPSMIPFYPDAVGYYQLYCARPVRV